MDNLYKLAWVRGLKTTYYLRSMGATHMEKSSSDSMQGDNKATDNSADSVGSAAPKACSILDPDCEACQ
jgi:ribonucleoside-diphosphate reductase alpha chain